MQPQLKRNAMLWVAFMVAYELAGVLCYAVHAGALGGGLLPIAPGPISVLIVDKEAEYGTDAYRPYENALSSSRIIAWLNAHCPKEDGAPSWRHWDRDTTLSKENSKWKPRLDKCRAAMDKAGVNTPVVEIVGQHGSTLQPFPPSENDALSLLKKWGGE